MLNLLRGTSRTPRSSTSTVSSSRSSPPPPPYTSEVVRTRVPIPAVEVRELECVVTLRKLLDACDQYRQGATDFWFALFELSIRSNLVLFAHCRRTDNNQKNLDLYNSILNAVLQLLREIDELYQWNNRSVRNGIQDISDGLSSFERTIHFSMPNYRLPNAKKNFRILDEYPMDEKLQRPLMKALGSRNMIHSRLFPTKGPSAYVEVSGGRLECGGTAFAGNTGSFEADFTTARITCTNGSIGSNNQFGMGANSGRVYAVDADIVTGGDSFCDNDNLGRIDLRGAKIRCNGPAFSGNRRIVVSSGRSSSQNAGHATPNVRHSMYASAPAGPPCQRAVANVLFPGSDSSGAASQGSSLTSLEEGPSFADRRARIISQSPFANRKLSVSPPTRLANMRAPASRRASPRRADNSMEPIFRQTEAVDMGFGQTMVKTVGPGSVKYNLVRDEDFNVQGE